MSAPRVLVADDQPDILHALRLLLAGAGCDADLVGSVREVIERVGREPYDLLLVDLNYTRDTTSGREGLELVHAVHRADRTLPIVVMTGWGAIETAVEAMRRGARGYVQKPWDDAALVEIVQREIAEGRMARHDAAKRARERDDARAIQRMLLPAAMPEVRGCTFAAVWEPAADLGGDCYDLLRLSDRDVAISIADVIGKGLPAALLMANFQAAIRAFASASAAPDDVCERVNGLVCSSVASGKFVTGCYALVDVVTGRVAYANAGHNAPMLVHADGRVDRLMPTGRVFGVTRDTPYATEVLKAGVGDRLVFFTDGITEARAADGTEFGDDRLVDLVRRHRSASADDLAGTVVDTVRTWASGVPGDDVTVIVAAF